MTASEVEICSQNPTRLPKRNSSTVSAPEAMAVCRGSSWVCDPIQAIKDSTRS